MGVVADEHKGNRRFFARPACGQQPRRIGLQLDTPGGGDHRAPPLPPVEPNMMPDSAFDLPITSSRHT